MSTPTATTRHDTVGAIRCTLLLVRHQLLRNISVALGLFMLVVYTLFFTQTLLGLMPLIILAMISLNQSTDTNLSLAHAIGAPRAVIRRVCVVLCIGQWLLIVGLFALFSPDDTTVRAMLFFSDVKGTVGDTPNLTTLVTFAMLTAAIQLSVVSRWGAVPQRERPHVVTLCVFFLPIVGYLVVSFSGYDVHGAVVALVVAALLHVVLWWTAERATVPAAVVQQRSIQHRSAEYRTGLSPFVLGILITVGLTVAVPTWLHFGSRHSGNPDAMWIASYAASAIGCAAAGLIGSANRVVTCVAAGHTRRYLTKRVLWHTLFFAALGTVLTAGLGLFGFAPSVFQLLATATACLCVGFAAALLVLIGQMANQLWHAVGWLAALYHLPALALIPFVLPDSSGQVLGFLSFMTATATWLIALAALWCWAGIKLPLDAKPEVGDHV